MKRLSFEFWPTWLLYLPVVLAGPYWWFKYKSFSVATLANPGFYFGGIKNDNKFTILEPIPSRFKPKTIGIAKNAKFTDVLAEMELQQIFFPCIIKPQYGERGKGVEKLDSLHALNQYLKQSKEPIMIQEFIDWPEEFGVMWYQIPGEGYGISSIIRKSFLTLKGDGASTVKELIEKEWRIQNRLDYLFEKHAHILTKVPNKGETILLEPIGNHCRGTVFEDINHLLTADVLATFKSLADHIPGFNIGRFDVKSSSLEDFLKGKNISVLEVNGITSEPAHIYHPGRGALKGWRDLLAHWNLVFKIGAINRATGLKPPGLFSVLKQMQVPRGRV